MGEPSWSRMAGTGDVAVGASDIFYHLDILWDKRKKKYHTHGVNKITKQYFSHRKKKVISLRLYTIFTGFFFLSSISFLFHSQHFFFVKFYSYFTGLLGFFFAGCCFFISFMFFFHHHYSFTTILVIRCHRNIFVGLIEVFLFYKVIHNFVLFYFILFHSYIYYSPSFHPSPLLFLSL